ncbi:MAG: hypothetical protein WCL44_06285 [bacterium]
MDLGILRLGRMGFWVAIAGPVAILAAVYLPGRLYARHINRTCDRGGAILDYMPEMNAKTRLAVATITRLVPVRGRDGDGSADLSLRIQVMAQQHGVVVRSLMPDQEGPVPGKAAGGRPPELPATIATMQCEGSLQGIAVMLDELQRPECLCRLDSVHIRTVTRLPEPVYGCEVVMRCYKAPAVEE